MWKTYKRKGEIELRDVTEFEIMNGLADSSISISEEDKLAGSPNHGDKIARNPDNHNDKWLIAKDYAEKNYELKETN